MEKPKGDRTAKICDKIEDPRFAKRIGTQLMTEPYLPNSIRKFLRKEKSRIRRDILDSVEAEKRIKELVEKTVAQYSKRRKV